MAIESTAEFQVSAGRPYPLGATYYPPSGDAPSRVNFALFSEHAQAVDLCLFDRAQGEKERYRLRLTHCHHGVWHGEVTGLEPGQYYGYRVNGEYAPGKGHFFNPAKLLLDPYAKAISGPSQWSEAMRGYAEGDLHLRDDGDNAALVPKSIVVNPQFDWEGDTQLNRPLEQTIIYEVHLKGLTQNFPGLDPAIRGTYAALASGPVIEYLVNLGITAVQLLPLQHRFDDEPLVQRALTNYWGYATMGFFAPEARYAMDCSRGAQVAEFQAMVKALHRAGIEVILDVVYNHTGEGGTGGPHVCFRGIDNLSYYCTKPGEPWIYYDATGCGHTFHLDHPRVLQLVLDSLRYWVEVMHVDGFRFDLAVSLGREKKWFQRDAAFFDAIAQDPVLSQVKLIAEPWDLGEIGYQLGNFPSPWSELNGQFRDTVRHFWKGDEEKLPELASRISGSQDIYGGSRRPPQASVNFITSHDGFTMRDLVSYNEKHNAANGEDNRDGDNHNHSWNHGVEGETDNEKILAMRRRQQRNFLSTLFVSLGVPMMLGGDEIGRTQGGNNNGYCQDNSTSWFDWENVDEVQLEFVRRLIAFRREHSYWDKDEFFHGKQRFGVGRRDILWLDEAGQEMLDEQWRRPRIKSLAFLIDRNRKRNQSMLYVALNADHTAKHFRLPEMVDMHWEWIVDTYREEGFLREPLSRKSGQNILIHDRSLCLLKARAIDPQSVASAQETKGGASES